MVILGCRERIDQRARSVVCSAGLHGERDGGCAAAVNCGDGGIGHILRAAHLIEDSDMLVHGPLGLDVSRLVAYSLGYGRFGCQSGGDGDTFIILHGLDVRFNLVASCQSKQHSCDSKYFLHCLVLL